MIAALTHEELQMWLALCQLRGWDEVAFDVRAEMQRRTAQREAEISDMS